MGKVIEFVKTKENTPIPNHSKETAHMLIDQCKGDFAIVFETASIKHAIEGEVNSDFVVAVSDVTRISTKDSRYFFKGFSGSRKYLDLDA